MPKPRVPVVVGPTAVGKTAFALALAQHWPILVISADSRQVYRGLDLGTGKPSRAELQLAPHRGLDLVDPGERYSAGKFARDAVDWLGEVPRGRRAVVVGGTGLYIRALVDGLFREPPLDPVRRRRLSAWSADQPAIARWATRLDDGYSGGGRQRAARAVEVALLTGRPLSWWQREARAQSVLQPVYVRLTLPRAVLHRRISERVQAWLAAGWVEEVRSVLASGVAPTAPGLDAVGYREIVRRLRGDLAPGALEQAIVAATRRYAKRQETWFRHQLGGGPVVTFDAGESADALARRFVEHWETGIA